MPLYEYNHSADNCSIIGGFVYRADASGLGGPYFFGDYCTGRVWTLNPSNLALVDRTAQLGPAAGVSFNLAGFGEDGIGRLLLVHRSAGTIYRIVPPPPPPGCGLGPELVPAVSALAGLRRARRGSVLRAPPTS